MFLPTTKDEMHKLGWKQADVIIVSGDAYIDSPNDGAAVIGKTLLYSGFKVAIISQPDINSADDITRLGSPLLFWGVTAGCVDSMVANYTALKKKKRSDDLTPGNVNNRRPDRAVIAYTNLIKKHFKNTVPIILGGVEASMRRVAHYDYWSDSIRRSVLLDSKADAIVYGMGEKSIIEIANKISKQEDWKSIPGICYASSVNNTDYIELPDYDSVCNDKMKFIEMFEIFYKNCDPYYAKGLVQKYGTRYVIQNPPQQLPSMKELDSFYDYNFERDAHPYYKKMGEIKSLETIRFSITSHRGCYGECSFCSIAIHQGRHVISRSEKSILDEAESITKLEGFKGYISDVGGPTANMYNSCCKVKKDKALCEDKSCTFPNVCKVLQFGHKPQIDLLTKIRNLKGVKKVFVSSGVRFDLVVEDKKDGISYLENLVENHVSGQMKIAPEHTEKKVLDAMQKNSSYLSKFKKMFDEMNKRQGKKQFLTYYFIAAHPGCDNIEMENLSGFLRNELGASPEQAQIFTPTPSTYSTLMYYTGINPFSGESIFVEKDMNKKQAQKEKIVPVDRRRK